MSCTPAVTSCWFYQGTLPLDLTTLGPQVLLERGPASLGLTWLPFPLCSGGAELLFDGVKKHQVTLPGREEPCEYFLPQAAEQDPIHVGEGGDSRSLSVTS